VIGGRRAQGQRRDLPEREAAGERRGHDLPVADDRLLGIPADRLGLVVGPDAQRIAVGVGLAVAVGDDDVASLEARHVAADLDDLADGGVARIDLAAAQLGDVDRVGGRGVGQVVLGRDHEDPQPDVARPTGRSSRVSRAITRVMSIRSGSPPTRLLSAAIASAVDGVGTGHGGVLSSSVSGRCAGRA